MKASVALLLCQANQLTHCQHFLTVPGVYHCLSAFAVIVKASVPLLLCQANQLTHCQHFLTVPGVYHCLSAFAVNAWLSEVTSDDAAVADSSRFAVMKEINKQLSIPQPGQLTAQQVDLVRFIPDDDTSIAVDLLFDLGSAGGDKVIRREVKVGASDRSGSVSDLTAEVDFEIAPDVSSESPCNCNKRHCWHSGCFTMHKTLSTHCAVVDLSARLAQTPHQDIL